MKNVQSLEHERFGNSNNLRRINNFWKGLATISNPGHGPARPVRFPIATDSLTQLRRRSIGNLFAKVIVSVELIRIP